MVLSLREQKQLRGLRHRKIREAAGCFLVEGVRAVEDLLASPLVVQLVVTSSSLEDSDRGQALAVAVDKLHITRRTVPDSELVRYAKTEAPQGVIAAAEIPQWRLSDFPVDHDPAVVLVLDAVQDPGNFGTLVRTAEALGAAGVAVLPGTVDPWNPKAVRSAVGSSFRIPIVATHWGELGPWLRQQELRVLAAAVGGTALDRNSPHRAALVLGNEGAGVSPESLEHADEMVGIPLRGRAESLNVAAAGAILLHQLLA
jgi:TrmH family RNA methyltransferase